MDNQVKVFPVYGRPLKFLPANDTIVLFYVPQKGIEVFAAYTGSRWLDPQNRAELDRYRTYENGKEWEDWVTRGKGKSEALSSIKILSPQTFHGTK